MNKTIGEFEVFADINYEKLKRKYEKMNKYSLISFLTSVAIALLTEYFNTYQIVSYIFAGIACISVIPLYLYVVNDIGKQIKIGLAFYNDNIIKIEIRESKNLVTGYMKALLYYKDENKEVHYWDVNVKLVNKTDIEKKTLLLDKYILYIPFN